MAELSFDCVGSRAERYSVVPALSLQLKISETSGQRVVPDTYTGTPRRDPSGEAHSSISATYRNGGAEEPLSSSRSSSVTASSRFSGGLVK